MEHLETTILIWFGLFVFKNCFYRLASCWNSEYQVRVVSGCQHLWGSWPARAPCFLCSPNVLLEQLHVGAQEG